MRKTGFLAALGLVMAAALSACGGGDAFNTPATTTGGSGGTTTTPTAASLVLTSDATSIPGDGSIPANITALVRDASNVVVKGVPITLSATSGSLTVGQGSSDATGTVLSVLGTAGDPTPRNITVTAKSGSLTSTVTVAVGVPPSTNPVAALTVVTSASTIPADGSAPATIAAIARDANNLLMKGVQVSFSSTSGGLAVTQPVTDANGQALATLTTAGDTTARTITVTASVTGKTATVPVTVAPSAPTTTVNLGTGTGASFQPNVLGLNPSSQLSAGGSTSVTATVVQSDGTLYTKPVTINFNSPCVAANTASIQPSANATTTTGQVTVTYSAKGCSGADIITATTSVGTQSLSATGTVTVAQATVGSITFVSATPTNIALKGTGSASRPETSTVIFRVLDASGGPRPGASVSFALNTAVGGVSLTPANTPVVSDAQGNVQIVVNAGTVATAVKVTATVANSSPQIATQSSQLTISTGIPTAGSFSLAIGCFNIEGWNTDGITTPVTARMGDRFGNPVPDGTAVTFTAEGGTILPQCLTTTNSTEGGLCSVTYRSSNPRPSDGRVSILGKAIGEESFTDLNGNGAFDNGEPFTDTSEPYRDDNENGVYDPGEDFFDFNNNGVRDGPDGKFNGVLCNDTTGRCGGPQSAGIGRSGVIVLSGSAAVISDPSGGSVPPVTVAVNATQIVNVWVRDVNANIMAGGTVVSASFSGNAASVAAPNAFNVPCAAPAAGSKISGLTVFGFGVTAGSSPGSGVLVISVKSPSGLTTILQVPVTVQ